MPGLVPGIHDLMLLWDFKTWMAGTKPGHDGGEVARLQCRLVGST
jgi:hypothetical protein